MDNMKWTLTKDSLPPEPVKLYDYCYCLATVTNDQVVTVRYCKTKIRNKEILRWEWNGRICPWEVLAWMTFPSAYVEPNTNSPTNK